MKDRLKAYIARLLGKLPPPLHRIEQEWGEYKLRRTLRRRYAAPDAVESRSQRPKVFGIGLSKTGTSSLHFALETLGYNTVHWRRGGKIVGWTTFSYFDGVTDINTAAQFESLYYSFQESRFIYTTRDLVSWTQSIEDHFSRYFGIQNPSDISDKYAESDFWGDSDHGWDWHNALRRIQIWNALYAQHDSWEDAYLSYDKRVRHFFRDKPENRFLEMNIVDGDGWEPLCEFLETDIPDRPFPHANKTPQTAKQS